LKKKIIIKKRKVLCRLNAGRLYALFGSKIFFAPHRKHQNISLKTLYFLMFVENRAFLEEFFITKLKKIIKAKRSISAVSLVGYLFSAGFLI